ncbi:hypothetical protein ABEB36_007848 [Hypothenemus hampei]|uniref:Uncharacterized protein n=1 Tax=Hypothenemus hampei TaxID=57062 RepID=A0ABD1EZ88_HYPHA
MNSAIIRLTSALCLLLLTFGAVDSLVCFKCSTGKCDTLEEETCGAAPPVTGASDAPAATTAAPAGFVEHDDPTTPAGGTKTYQCFTLKGKAKAGGEEMVYKGCTPDSSCAAYTSLLQDDAVCSPCPEEKCNFGNHLTPLTMVFMIFVAFACLFMSQ